MRTKTDSFPTEIFTLTDYRSMFDLSDDDLVRTLFNYPAGLSSFNAEMYARQGKVVSGDPLYRLTPLEMSQQADDKIQQLAAELNPMGMSVQSADKKARADRLYTGTQAIQQFLSDYSLGRSEKRYQFMQLPTLPFQDFAFDIALCPHGLFHDDQHAMTALTELCRVAREVRIFPLPSDQGKVTTKVGPLLLDLQQRQYGVEIREVPYQLQKGHNAMLRVWAKKCMVNS